MRPLPPVLFLLTLAAMAAVHRLWPEGDWLAPPWTRSGLVPILAGGVLGAHCIAGFLARGNALPPGPGRSERLVVSGAYRFSRNPMYLSFALILTGAGLLMGGMPSLIGPPVFLLTVDRLWVRREEEWLEAEFGDDYRHYRSSVRRWL